ncbi:hypothetical protein [Nostocoides sp. HKS02]|uniref:hypothetical protein n=1 Tax=Nostocoides sp. HKS02 TaxID=1813880 RepID=UPI001E375326|nr:hypothetical protein [Tetrasphaera sp. HKS02]
MSDPPLYVPTLSSVDDAYAAVEYVDDTYVSNVAVIWFEAYVGSIVTGNTRAGSLSHPWSGVSVSTALPLPCWVTVIATGETFGWSPVCGSTVASKATGAVSFEATVPSAATNDTDPSCSGRAVSPLVFTGICQDTGAPAVVPSVSPASAARLATTRCSSKPVRRASTTRSTPGFTAV